MLHTLEDFCGFLWPDVDADALRRRYYWLCRLTENGRRAECYRELLLPRGDGRVRRVQAPSEPLKRVQRALLPLLSNGEVSPHAAAYRKGVCIRDNAAPHAGSPLVVKLDIHDFFGSIRFASVFSAIDRALRLSPLAGVHYLNAYDRSEPDPRHYNRVLSYYFTCFCTLHGGLVQGAPTSPHLSNLVFAPLDTLIAGYCQKRRITYTRYSDDMTFSGAFNAHGLMGFVEHLLRVNGYRLNEKKTAVLGKGVRQKITGVVVNSGPQSDRQYRRTIRQEMHYMQVYGLEAHMARKGEREPPQAYLRRLMGRIGFVLQIQPDDPEFLEYRGLCAALLKALEIG